MGVGGVRGSLTVYMNVKRAWQQRRCFSRVWGVGGGGWGVGGGGWGVGGGGWLVGGGGGVRGSLTVYVNVKRAWQQRRCFSRGGG